MELGSKDSGALGDQTQPGLKAISIIGLRYLSHDTNECASQFVTDTLSLLHKHHPLIGEVDILIASIALIEGLAVATHNVSHFARVNSLQVVDWTV